MNNKFRDFSADEIRILLTVFEKISIILSFSGKDQDAAFKLKEQLREWTNASNYKNKV